MNPVLGGLIGPLVAVVVTWLAVSWTFRRNPAAVTNVMLAAFLVKVIFFAAYVVLMVRVLAVEPKPFIIAFATSFIVLYGLEAWLFARLFRQGVGR
jgi:hypothetical protein